MPLLFTKIRWTILKPDRIKILGLVLLVFSPLQLWCQNGDTSLRPQPGKEGIEKVASTSQDNKLSEDELWQQAREKHSESIYRQYKLLVERGLYSGKYLDEANDMILEIREENAWNELNSKGDKQAYRDYLNRYPDGKYTTQAKEALAGLSPRSTPPASSPPKMEITIYANPEDSLWNEIFQAPTEEGYRRYLHTFPQGKYVDRALDELPIYATLERSERDSQFQLLKLEFVKYPVRILKVEIPETESSFTPSYFDGSIKARFQYSRDSSYTYLWENEDFIANIESMGEMDAVVSLGIGQPMTHKITFADALGREKIFLININTSPLELIALWGKDIEDDSLFICMTGGMPPYSIRLNSDENQYFQLELPLIEDTKKANTWYLLKEDAIQLNNLDQPYYFISIFDAQRRENISFNQRVFFQEEWYFDWLLSWKGLVLLLFVMGVLSWLIFKYGRMII